MAARFYAVVYFPWLLFNHSLGFKNVCTIEQIAEAYPLLDMVDHDNRRKIVSYWFYD